MLRIKERNRFNDADRSLVALKGIAGKRLLYSHTL